MECNQFVLSFLLIEFPQDARHKDMLQLLEKIPFSDPSLLVPTYKTFGKQVYDLLHKFDAKEDDSQKGPDSKYVHMQKQGDACTYVW